MLDFPTSVMGVRSVREARKLRCSTPSHLKDAWLSSYTLFIAFKRWLWQFHPLKVKHKWDSCFLHRNRSKFDARAVVLRLIVQPSVGSQMSIQNVDWLVPYRRQSKLSSLGIALNAEEFGIRSIHKAWLLENKKCRRKKKKKSYDEWSDQTQDITDGSIVNIYPLE